ncbi:MAG: hypothetical protein ACPGSD_15335 [Flavobacteriales bacterium]
MNTIIKFSIFTVIISVSIWFLPNLLSPKPNITSDRSHQNSQRNSQLKLLKTEGELSLINTTKENVIKIVSTDTLKSESKTDDLKVTRQMIFESDLEIDIHVFDQEMKYLKSVRLKGEFKQRDFELNNGLYYLQFIDSKDRSKTIWLKLQETQPQITHTSVA